MFDIAVPDAAFGILFIAGCLFYSAWYDYSIDNKRDARLLAAFGTVSLMGGTVAYLH